MVKEQEAPAKSVRGYLAALAWDGVPRLDGWLIDCAGAENTPLVRAASRQMLVAAVRRAQDPGCRFDQLPILVGPQACGKTSALRSLAVEDDWFCDGSALGSADELSVVSKTEGRWIVEAGELSGDQCNSDAVARLKAFLSRTHDSLRRPHALEVTRVPRQFVVVGTSHEGGFFEDVSSRRFWPVRVRLFDLDRLLAIRDQLWAEAAVSEAAGQALYLPDVA